MRKAAWLASKEGAEHFNAPFCRTQAEVRGNIKKETKRNDMSEICFKMIQCGEWDRDDVRLGHGSVVEAVRQTQRGWLIKTIALLLYISNGPCEKLGGKNKRNPTEKQKCSLLQGEGLVTLTVLHTNTYLFSVNYELFFSLGRKSWYCYVDSVCVDCGYPPP